MIAQPGEKRVHGGLHVGFAVRPQRTNPKSPYWLLRNYKSCSEQRT
jgi:hypothetical protein